MTERTRHTPGPWFPTEESGGLVVSGRGVCFVADCRKAFETCSETQDLITFEERRSNARLIAAAPDLLKALQEILRLCPAFRIQPIGAPASAARLGQDAQIASENAAYAAIAKALGDST